MGGHDFAQRFFFFAQILIRDCGLTYSSCKILFISFSAGFVFSLALLGPFCKVNQWQIAWEVDKVRLYVVKAY